MSNGGVPNWLRWAREIQSLAQTGLHYADNEFTRERNQRLNEIAAEIIAEYTTVPLADTIQVFNNQVGYATPRVDVRGAVFDKEKRLHQVVIPLQEKDRVQVDHRGLLVEQVYPLAGILVRRQEILDQKAVPKVGLVKPELFAKTELI